MYLEHFGLSVPPFSLSPKLEFLYESEPFQESMAHLLYGVDNSEAITMITGAIGTGKTIALQSFLSNLGPGFHTALVTNTQVTMVELLKLILEDLDIEFPMGCDKSDLLIRFKDFLLEASLQGRRVIIVIDEAQNLSREVLEEVRLLTNLGQGDLQPVQVILVGQPELDEIVNQPNLAQLRQRIRVHYRLEPLTRKEVAAYLDHRMTVADGQRGVFQPAAVDRIYEYSGGIPRLVNSLAGNALLSAFVSERSKIKPEDVDAPEGRPAPAAVPVASAPPAPASRPEAAPPRQPESPPAAFASYAEPRRSRRRRPRLWPVAAVLVLAAAALYFTGSLDGLIAGVLDSGQQADAGPRSAVTPPAPVPAPAAAAAVVDTLPRTEAQPADVAETPIEVPAKEPVVADTGQPAAPPEVPTGLFIHVSSFREQARAEGYAAGLRTRGYQVTVLLRTVSESEWYRVYVGPYDDRTEALNEVERLQRDENVRYYKITRLDGASGS